MPQNHGVASPVELGGRMMKALNVGLVIWACGAAAWAGPEYALTVLDPVPGHDASCASGINDVGQIVGESDNQADYPSRPVATLWQGGQVIELDTAGRVSKAAAINRHGRVAGTLEPVPDRGGRAFSLRPQKGLLHLLPGESARAWAINDRGVIVGGIGEFPRLAYVYDRGVMTLLDVPAEWAMATGINNAGAISITASWGEGYGGFVYESGVLTELGDGTDAVAINSSGIVAGSRSGRDGTKVFLFSKGSLLTLENPPGMTDCYARGLNDANVVVGFCQGGDTRVIAMWRDGKTFDLSKMLANAPPEHWSP